MDTTTLSIEDRVHERFTEDTTSHQLQATLHDGLYRHLRFGAPKTSAYWFDLITWPGVLTVHGDCGTFVFSRTTDMFEFFESDGGHINPHYWSEKLQAPKPQAVREWSRDAYERAVEEWLTQHEEEANDDEMDGLRAAAREQLLDREANSVHEAMSLLYDFEHKGVRISEPYEWNLTDWNFRFLWCCHAIVWGIAKYREATDA